MESKPISVINGCERGGSIKDIVTSVQPSLLKNLVPNYHVFLDNNSGDIYSYNENSLEWKPIGNVGVHDSRALLELTGVKIANSLRKTKTHSQY